MNSLFGDKNVIDVKNNINTYFNETKNFLNSNSPLAIISFFIFIIVIFIILLKLGSSLISYLFQPKKNVTLINGLIDSKHMVSIPQDPNNVNSIPIVRSKNEEEGLEFTWSVWINIDDLVYKQNEYKHVFHKGENNINTEKNLFGINFPNNGPGLYIGPVKNELVIIMNTFKTIKEEIIIDDIPLNKWVNVIIRVNNQNVLDVYINGNLARRHILDSVPKQNYGDVYVSANGGFSGLTSDLKYYAEAIDLSEIQSIIYNGPNLKMINNSFINSVPKYLSLRWFFNNDNDNENNYYLN
jgi:hypothetical protein